MREQVNGVIPWQLDINRITPEFNLFHLVFKAGDLCPLARWLAQIMRELAAVAVGDGGDDEAAVVAGLQRDFGDPRKFLPQLVTVLLDKRADFVEVNTLIKAHVIRRDSSSHAI